VLSLREDLVALKNRVGKTPAEGDEEDIVSPALQMDIAEMLRKAGASQYAKTLSDTQINRLIQDLDSEDFDRRQDASLRLAGSGRAQQPVVLAALQNAMKGSPSPEFKERGTRLVNLFLSPKGYESLCAGVPSVHKKKERKFLEERPKTRPENWQKHEVPAMY